jgi:hypothetical protein
MTGRGVGKGFWKGFGKGFWKGFGKGFWKGFGKGFWKGFWKGFDATIERVSLRGLGLQLMKVSGMVLDLKIQTYS